MAENSRDLRRFLTHLDALRNVLPNGWWGQPWQGAEGRPGHKLLALGARTPAFMLQGLARVYGKLDLKGLEPEVFDRLKTEVKILEDALGQVDFWWVVRRKAAEHALPAEVQTWADHRHAEAAGRAAAWVEAREWVAHRYVDDEEPFEARVDRLERRLRKLRWPSPRKSAEAFRKFLAAELAETDTEVAALDLTDIEQGVHEARRKIRWLSIYAFANTGAVALDTSAKAPRGWSRYLAQEVVSNPFNKLPAAEPEDRPVTLPAPLFYALSYLIDRLGQLKDRVQWTETLQHGLDETASGGKRRDAASYLGAAALHAAQATSEAAALVEQVVRKDRVLQRLGEAVAACDASSPG